MVGAWGGDVSCPSGQSKGELSGAIHVDQRKKKWGWGKNNAEQKGSSKRISVMNTVKATAKYRTPCTGGGVSLGEKSGFPGKNKPAARIDHRLAPFGGGRAFFLFGWRTIFKNSHDDPSRGLKVFPRKEENLEELMTERKKLSSGRQPKKRPKKKPQKREMKGFSKRKKHGKTPSSQGYGGKRRGKILRWRKQHRHARAGHKPAGVTKNSNHTKP